jgi:hypothetical protein
VRFDQDRGVLLIDERRWLPVSWHEVNDFEGPSFSHHTRSVIVPFENRWQLSVIWGTATYSSNYNTLTGYDFAGNPVPPFTDEPQTVEVGIMLPEPIVRPAITFDIDIPGMKLPTPTIPERESALWGDPLAWVWNEALWWLATEEVSRWPSDNKPLPRDGPYLHGASQTGPFMLTINEYAIEEEERVE